MVRQRTPSAVSMTRRSRTSATGSARVRGRHPSGLARCLSSRRESRRVVSDALLRQLGHCGRRGLPGKPRPF
ncbi:hypothetical protein CMP1-67 [Clavibacter phage CMP1]|uniref:Uncharacterized protein n=1 Tax=Clavibacter phage CMP1 TaxID=686439 RepID=D0U251_9CAUD|nr:hypothetical protein CMP1-67 [Clavibacter phage CMP1]ACY35959.1 hypothetical protein CMP1-67 [Clavibacter phage CMP1]